MSYCSDRTVKSCTVSLLISFFANKKSQKLVDLWTEMLAARSGEKVELIAIAALSHTIFLLVCHVHICLSLAHSITLLVYK